ncbi:peptidase domain-containing ABC transporter [Nostoc parmelioides]|uniref:Peptidase domain-containing ABC transporter n=1 Tax=Nostoc parmelioides FACHB-3921 TaxID=2692909 RepID=A0ABR8BJ87_9NOSO|nr:peptidase domain-containing ABC transporter [Nostoc parmelioides]MBD2252776.1 peptidase domain-containing ABC transporter [Nostoc parmelioides FACHB-3921]
MTTSIPSISDFLTITPPFNLLSTAAIEQLTQKAQLLRYRMGQTIVVKETMPAHVAIIYEGQARLIGYNYNSAVPDTIELLQPGAILGWVSLLRGVACETAIASTEAVCLTIPSVIFQTLFKKEKAFTDALIKNCATSELVDLLSLEIQRRALGEVELTALVPQILPQTVVLNLPKGKTALSQLDPHRLWLLSSGNTNFAIGDRIEPYPDKQNLKVESGIARLIGIPPVSFQPTPTEIEPEIETVTDDIPYASEQPPALESKDRQGKYPYVGGKGVLNETLACFQMLSQYWNMPFRRDVIRRVLQNQQQRLGSVSLQLCGSLAEMLGLRAQLAVVPAIAISRLQTPVMLQWQNCFAILYKATDSELVLGVPGKGIQRHKPKAFIETWGEQGEILLLQPTKETPRKRFGLSWFLPFVSQYRRVLSEVLISSFFVQLFGLANPLITQVIIDKVLIQNSPATLNVLGTLLVATALFEAVLTTLRTNLFVETTNRIDMALGSEVINHLLRLPLGYFEKRPVGELSTRINELENIRQFLTGTALTVVLDAIFSVIYIVVMLYYSWLLTLVALATVPLFALLGVIVAPVIRQQTRTRAERNAATQSYLVEVVSGIQTVKAQNIELRSRWQWQDRYARYVADSFKNALTSTTAGSISKFLNQLSGLLLLWVGAFLVLQGTLTLGQLIAFRIIAGYTTSPLLRLVQLWQNFQETALSLERLSDILDTPQEEAVRQDIPLPDIQGAVKYDHITFRFTNSPTPQLDNINLDIPPGKFVGVVGQSGAGKSTLTKLLTRLYDPEAGRILIDGYDIHKVELYSLRRQIGMVLQDTLLFDTTVQENIALNNPEATPEEIINAAKIAYAHDFIMSLPMGYNTRVGERGSALSGGQRQRIAIARTVLQNPRLLIMDEATSALDYNSERQVCQNLQQALEGRTVFFITHRLGTIRHADIILMMEQGRIAEQGTHDELMALRGLYYCLYRQQEAVVV